MAKKTRNIVKKKPAGTIKKVDPFRRTPECDVAVELVKKKGFDIKAFEEFRNERQVMFVYYYLTNGFNASKAARDCGYNGCDVYANEQKKKPKIAKAIKEGLKLMCYLENDVTISLSNMMGLDVADYEPYLNGEMTLKELRDTGVDTSLLDGAQQGTDKYGKPWAKITTPAKLEVYKTLLKFMLADKEADTQPNIHGNVINVTSSTPGFREREEITSEDQMDIIDVETEKTDE